MDQVQLQYYKFVVDETPYCMWDLDIKKRSIRFLDDIDPGYFEYLARVHGAIDSEEDKQNAALAIRSAYSQGLETFFALLCAMIQAPHCIPGWMARYGIPDLINLVAKIKNRQPILSRFDIDRFTWQSLAEIIHSFVALEDKEQESRVNDRFGQLWAYFATDFLKEGRRFEYNSLKHGLRLKPGGFYFAIGKEDSPGVRAPRERMQLLGSSEFGSSFLISENIGRKRLHFRLKRRSLNWSPENMILGLELITLSIGNLISYLKILNGVPRKEIKFQYPSERVGPVKSLVTFSVTSPAVSPHQPG